jgi:tetratricopeptide (TPR) repeat protein
MALKLRDNPKKQAVSKPLPPHLQAKFQQAMQYHQIGDLARAQTIYQEILAGHPKHADSLHLSGLLAYQEQRFETAAKLMSKAIRVNPNEAAF